MESPRTVEILEALRWLSLTPGERRKTPPPELTPLSKEETRTVRDAIEAAEMGIDVVRVLGMELCAERLYQSPADRKHGRIAPEADLPPVLEALRVNPWCINSHRLRRRFMRWLWDEASDRDARKALRHLKTPQIGRPVPRLSTLVRWSVDVLTDRGMSRAAAARAVAKGEGAPAPVWLHERLGRNPPPPMPLPDVLALLRLADVRRPRPPQRAPHKRPGRNKRETPGNPVYSDPKTAQEAGLSTLPSRRSTGAEGKRNDELPNDNRSRRPAQGAATNAQGLEAQRKGAAILEAVRKPRAVRGRGAVAVPRGSDVRSHGRGDDSARKRPGRVKEPP